MLFLHSPSFIAKKKLILPFAYQSPVVSPHAPAERTPQGLRSSPKSIGRVSTPAQAVTVWRHQEWILCFSFTGTGHSFFFGWKLLMISSFSWFKDMIWYFMILYIDAYIYIERDWFTFCLFSIYPNPLAQAICSWLPPIVVSILPRTMLFEYWKKNKYVCFFACVVHNRI